MVLAPIDAEGVDDEEMLLLSVHKFVTVVMLQQVVEDALHVMSEGWR